jgi:hypothetical protein
MTFSNIISIIIILLVIGTIAYIYLNPPSKNSAVIKPELTKHVQFDDNIKYDTSSDNLNLSSDIPMLDSIASIDFDDLSSIDNMAHSETKSPHYSDNLTPTMPVSPINAEQVDKGWDANFGVPLATSKETAKHINKIKKEHEDYQKSLGKFTRHQTDNDILIKSDVTIDPFDPKNKSRVVNKTVQEIYDDCTKAPQAKPKRVLKTTPLSVVYENESEMNGGRIRGTRLSGYDKLNKQQIADFGDAF